MKRCLVLIVSFVGIQVARAQLDSTTRSDPAQFRHRGDYFEKKTYFGANHDFYTISTFLKDSILYRVDTYRLIQRVNPFTNRLDTNKVAIHQGPTKVMYPTGQVYLSCSYEINALHGPLSLYYADGSLKRRELYHFGALRESQCYTQQGGQQPCAPLYQLPHFTGKPNQLKRYLEKSLQTVAADQQVRDITIALLINELGQVAQTKVQSRPNPNDSKLITSVLETIRTMPQWTPGRLSWQPATMDGVAVEEQWVIYIHRKQGFLYVYLPDS